jgi:hypothetical protein
MTFGPNSHLAKIPFFESYNLVQARLPCRCQKASHREGGYAPTLDCDLLVSSFGFVASLVIAHIMRRQSVILWRQTKANIRAAKAAESAAIEAKRNTQIIVDKERARVSLEVGTLSVGHRNDPPNESWAAYTIRCNGTTQAEIIKADIGIRLHETGPATGEYADKINLPAVLMPGAIQGQVYLSGVAGTDAQSRFDKGELYARLYGWIVYKDIFGSSWTYAFDYLRTHDSQWMGGGKEIAYEDEDEKNSGPSATEIREQIR